MPSKTHNNYALLCYHNAFLTEGCCIPFLLAVSAKPFYYFTDPYTYFQVGMTQKEREEGASHTLLTVRFIIYQHHSLLLNIPL